MMSSQNNVRKYRTKGHEQVFGQESEQLNSDLSKYVGRRWSKITYFMTTSFMDGLNKQRDTYSDQHKTLD